MLSTDVAYQFLPIIKWCKVYNLSSASKSFAEMVGMAISVAIGHLNFDKRKGLMSLLESRNDMVRCNMQPVKVQVHSEWDLGHVP
jgi:hypothetical protein